MLAIRVVHGVHRPKSRFTRRQEPACGGGGHRSHSGCRCATIKTTYYVALCNLTACRCGSLYFRFKPIWLFVTTDAQDEKEFEANVVDEPKEEGLDEAAGAVSF